ncbi:MAG: LysM peptidoglycan-binding domain-containing protein [Dehalococcoidia bacterium]|nr:LysM peptidoglycan-binding domain-containing protein [Dehalococcoidia bacterium]
MTICYACSHEAESICPRCGRAYCPDHGADVCAYCANPASGVPSRLWYRGSVLALLATVVVGIWLLAVTPELRGNEPAADQGPEGPTGATATTVAGGTRTPGPTGKPGTQRHTVKLGDTLVSIASQYGVTVDTLKQANGLSSDLIQVGQELTVPR